MSTGPTLTPTEDLLFQVAIARHRLGDSPYHDTVEVIEARNGAPFDDLMDEWGERRRARAVAEAEDRATRVRRARRESAWWFRLAQYLRADTTSKEPSDD